MPKWNLYSIPEQPIAQSDKINYLPINTSPQAPPQKPKELRN